MIEKINGSMRYLGQNPINSDGDDTTANWASLGTGYAIMYGNAITTAPHAYGLNISFVSGDTRIFQIWKNSYGNGGFYLRVGTANGWTSSWQKIYTQADKPSSSTIPTGGEEGQLLTVNSNGTISPNERTIASLGTGATYSLNGTTLTITTI